VAPRDGERPRARAGAPGETDAPSLQARPTLAIIAVTGYGQASDRRQSKEAGFDAHLVKPLDLDVLESLLKRLAVS
jgi:CheY-like chemotaxis protein